MFIFPEGSVLLKQPIPGFTGAEFGPRRLRLCGNAPLNPLVEGRQSAC
jgi:hypothetical protein